MTIGISERALSPHPQSGSAGVVLSRACAGPLWSLLARTRSRYPCAPRPRPAPSCHRFQHGVRCAEPLLVALVPHPEDGVQDAEQARLRRPVGGPGDDGGRVREPVRGEPRSVGDEPVRRPRGAHRRRRRQARRGQDYGVLSVGGPEHQGVQAVRGRGAALYVQWFVIAIPHLPIPNSAPQAY